MDAKFHEIKGRWMFSSLQQLISCSSLPWPKKGGHLIHVNLIKSAYTVSTCVSRILQMLCGIGYGNVNLWKIQWYCKKKEKVCLKMTREDRTGKPGRQSKDKDPFLWKKFLDGPVQAQLWDLGLTWGPLHSVHSIDQLSLRPSCLRVTNLKLRCQLSLLDTRLYELILYFHSLSEEHLYILNFQIILIFLVI